MSGRRRTLARKLLLQLALLPLYLVLAEIATRIALGIRGDGYEADAARAEMLAIVSAMSESLPERFGGDPGSENGREPGGEGAEESGQELVLHPYTGWDNRNSAKRVAQDFLDAGEASSDEYTILVLGGSVAAGFRRRGDEVLRKRLLADPRFEPRAVRFLHYARAAFKQPQQVTQLGWLFALGIVPDAVLNIDGFNEVAISHRNSELGLNPAYPSSYYWSHLAQGREVDRAGMDLELDVWRLQREAQAIARTALDRGYARSSILGTLTLARLTGRQRAWTASVNAYAAHLAERPSDASVRGPALEADAHTVLGLSVGIWERSSRALRALCAERGVLYVHVLQPTLCDSGRKPATEEERVHLTSQSYDTQAVERGYPLLREAGGRLRAADVAFVDATDVFANVAETLYTDFCHFNRAGYKLFAARIADGFLEAYAAPEATRR